MFDKNRSTFNLMLCLNNVQMFADFTVKRPFHSCLHRLNFELSKGCKIHLSGT